MNSFTLITGNQNKLDEYKRYIKQNNSNINLLKTDIDIAEIQSLDHKEIMINKIKAIAKEFTEPFIVDDVCFFTEKYKNFPGPYAKFINNTLGIAGWEKLFEEGDAISAVATLGLYSQAGIKLFEGRIDGVLSFVNKDKINPQAPINNIFFLPKENDFLGNLLVNVEFRNHRRIAFEKLLTEISEQ